MPSAPQTLAVTQIFDYSYGPDGKALQGKRVKVTLGYDQAITVATEPVVNLEQQEVYSTVTDANGYWTVSLVPNNRITPANTYYTVNIEGYRSYQITVSDQSVPVGGWQTSAILLSAPSVLAPVSQTVGNLTVTGTLTVSGTLSISGGFTVSGNLTVTGTLTVSGLSIEQGGLTVTGGITMADAGVSRIIPSAAGWSLRNNANSADNLAMTDLGVATIRGGLTVTAGGLAVSAGGLTVTAGGATIAAGGLTVTGAPDLTLGTAASRVVPGATSISLRNRANTADNLLLLDNGNATFRGTVVASTTNYRARAYRSTTQTLTGVSNADIQYDTISYDPNNNFTTGASAHYTVPLAGKYLIAVRFSSVLGGANVVYASIYVNAVEVSRGVQVPGTAGTWGSEVVDVLALNTSDSVTGHAFVTGPGAILDAGSVFNYIAIQYLGP